MNNKERFTRPVHPNALRPEQILRFKGAEAQISYIMGNNYCPDRESAERVISSSLNALWEVGTKRKFYAGETIYNQGDKPNNLILLESGLAFTYLDSSRGSRLVGEIIEGTTIAGTEKAGEYDERTNALEAVTQCRVQFINKKDVGNKMLEVPELGLFLLATQSLRHQKRDERMSRLLLYNNTRQRVAFTLLELAKYEEGLEAALLTQTRIGELSGCTRESANRTLVELKNKKIIDYTQYQGNKVLRLKIEKPEELEELIDVL